ncbi:type III pantothenate kinase [bacterium]|nr:type III pantothenate kinase [bacterium]MBU1983717.1 type III pantothenate kinase [bacterium]
MSSRLLAIDVGNSVTTLGLFEDSRLLDRWRMASRTAWTEDEIWILISQFLTTSGFAMDSLSFVSIASVVPELTTAHSNMSARRLGVRPLVISASNVKLLRVDYEPLSSVGADRLCGAAAAFVMHGGPVVVVDLGTATVFDFVTKDGIYRGGLITPGIATAVESLHQAAAMLPRVDIVFPSSLIGRTTETAIQSGVLHGTVAMIDGIVDRIHSEVDGSLRVVATGGFAGLLQERSRVIRHVEPDLVLNGIRLITENQ